VRGQYGLAARRQRGDSQSGRKQLLINLPSIDGVRDAGEVEREEKEVSLVHALAGRRAARRRDRAS
jgi:hypothetical protein